MRCPLRPWAHTAPARAAPALLPSPLRASVLWPLASFPCGFSRSAPPGASGLHGTWHADGGVLPWDQRCLCHGRLHACTCTRVCPVGLQRLRRALAPVLPIPPEGPPACRTLPTARNRVSAPVRLLLRRRLPWEPPSSLPPRPSQTPSFCTDPFPRRRLPRAPTACVGHPSFLPLCGLRALIRLDSSFPATTAPLVLERVAACPAPPNGRGIV